MRKPFGAGGLTAWSLAALAAGAVLGFIGNASGSPGLAALARALQPFGQAWLSALQLIVLPLVLAHVMAAVVAARDGGALGALGAKAMGLFVAMLLGVGAITLAAAAAIVSRMPFDAETAAALRDSAVVPEDARALAALDPSFGEWLASLVPDNLFQAALDGEVLPLLLFAVVLGIAITRLPDDQRAPLASAIQGLASAMLMITRWLLWLIPLGVFVLIFPVVLGAGGGATTFLAAYVVIQCALVFAVTLLVYPFTSLLGKRSMGAFARGVLPAQLVAASTRSSIASLPALVQGGRERLGLPAAATGVVLPLAIAVFKLSRTVSAPLRLMFLAHMYQIPLTGSTIAVFMVTIIILSFGSVGLPSSALPVPTLPAYVVAGIPLEGVIIMEAVDAIPDIFKTVLNVTGDMSAATILSRSSPRAA